MVRGAEVASAAVATAATAMQCNSIQAHSHLIHPSLPNKPKDIITITQEFAWSFFHLLAFLSPSSSSSSSFSSPLLPVCMMYVLILCVILFVIWFIKVDADIPTYFLSLLPATRARIRSRYSSKVVWILGASSGIGKELALQLSEVGAKLVLSARRKEELERVERLCKERGGKNVQILCLPMDMTALDSHDSCVNRVLSVYNSIDVCILNAGRSQRSTGDETSFNDHMALCMLNLHSQIHMSQKIVPIFRQQKGGEFIIMSSVSGLIAAPLNSSYNASKFGLTGYFESIRCEMGDEGVKINIIHPGPVATPIGDNALSSNIEARKNEKKETKLSVERCVHLTLTACCWDLMNTIITKNPILLFCYLGQYAPTLQKYLFYKIGPKRVYAFKKGADAYSFKSIFTAKKES